MRTLITTTHTPVTPRYAYESHAYALHSQIGPITPTYYSRQSHAHAHIPTHTPFTPTGTPSHTDFRHSHRYAHQSHAYVHHSRNIAHWSQKQMDPTNTPTIHSAVSRVRLAVPHIRPHNIGSERCILPHRESSKYLEYAVLDAGARRDPHNDVAADKQLQGSQVEAATAAPLPPILLRLFSSGFIPLAQIPCGCQLDIQNPAQSSQVST